MTKVVYIGGYSRSGTTLLARLLARTPRVVAVGELTELWQRSYLDNQLCGCGVPFLDCDFWNQVSKDAFASPSSDVPAAELQAMRSRAQGYHRIPQLAYPRLRNRRHRADLLSYREQLARLYAAIARVSGADLVVDSSKVPQYAWVLAGIPSLEMHLVHLVRDSRATAYSWQRRKARPEIHWKSQEMDRYSLIRSSVEWDVFNLALAARRSVAHSYTVLRYEDLVTDPRHCLSRVAEAVGSPLPTAPDVGGIVELDQAHTTAGNPSRFETGSTPIRLDEAWRSQMSRRSQLGVTLLTAPVLQRYGYGVLRSGRE